MINRIDSEKLTKVISAVCFAGAVLAGHTFAGDVTAEVSHQAERATQSSKRSAGNSAGEEIEGNPTVHRGMSGTNEAEMTNRAQSAESDSRGDADEPRMELTKELDIANPAKRTNSPNE